MKVLGCCILAEARAAKVEARGLERSCSRESGDTNRSERCSIVHYPRVLSVGDSFSGSEEVS